jgi:hypothetical protein
MTNDSDQQSLKHISRCTSYHLYARIMYAVHWSSRSCQFSLGRAELQSYQDA